MRNLDNKAADSEQSINTCKNFNEKNTPCLAQAKITDVTSKIGSDVDLEAQKDRQLKDPLLEVAELIVALKLKKLKYFERLFALFVIALWFARPLWLSQLDFKYEILDEYLSRSTGVIPSLILFLSPLLKLQHCMNTTTLKNLRNGVNLNKHDICNIGNGTKCLFGTWWFLSMCWSLWVTLFCPTALLNDRNGPIAPAIAVTSVFSICLMCHETFMSPKVNLKVYENADVEKLLQGVVQGKSEFRH